MRLTNLVVFACLVVVAGHALADGDKKPDKLKTRTSFPDLIIQGETYHAACGPAEWPAVEAALIEAAGRNQPVALVSAVKTYLCDQGAQANATLRKNMPANIPHASEATGTEGEYESTLAREEISTRGGAAWNVEVRAHGGRVMVFYQPDEACVESADFHFRRNIWSLSALSGACD